MPWQPGNLEEPPGRDKIANLFSDSELYKAIINTGLSETSVLSMGANVTLSSRL